MTTDSNLTTSDLAGAPTPDQPVGAVQDDVTATPETDGAAAPQAAPLFSGDEAESFRTRWQDVQTRFVDEPRQSVEEADALVAELMKRLAQTFADERANLEAQWGQGENVGTEELRVALQRYRSFFERLLST